jgi:formate C-acetyltransferase
MAKITFSNLSLSEVKPTERVRKLKDAYFKALPEICIERPRLITDFHKNNGLFSKDRISILEKARAYRYALERREPVIWHRSSHAKGMVPFALEGAFEDRSLFAGSTTGKFKGVLIYPEFLGLALWPELWSISTRESNPYHLAEEDAEKLNFEIFPHWMKKNIHEIGRARNPRGMNLLERLVFFLNTKTECISHTIPDFSKAVHLCLRAVINEAKERGAKTANADQKEFYAAIAEAMEGIIAYSRNVARKAEKMAAEQSDPATKKELLDIARINSRIPEFPAESFREALTAVWICWTAIHLENANAALSLGRLDQLLYEHYRTDIEKKILTIEDAVELICCLWLKIGDHVPSIPDAAEQLFGGTGSNQAITIGGLDKDGNDAVNDLTYVMLRATELMKLRDPNLNARYCPGVNSKEYLRRLCEANIITKATPALHNDKAVIRALTAKGETEEQARDYGLNGCIEPGSCGRHYGATGAILFNLTSALELTLFNGKHRHTGLEHDAPQIGPKTGEVDGFTSFDDFKKAFEEQVQWVAEQAAHLNNTLGTVHQDVYPTPVLSALFEGPMDKGKDLIQGGAVINSSGVTVVGLADVADSLSAIQKVVFEEKALSFREFIESMNSNYQGRKDWEVLQKRLMNPEKTPKYGNEDPIADGNVTWIVKLMDNVFDGQENYRGGRYRVGYWTMTNHAGFGRLMKATPSGRKAHENFTSGITPVSGVTPYLTKTLNSVGSQPAECIANGMAFNIKYTPETDKQKMLDNFAASVEGFFEKGGMEIQFNVTDHQTFADAFKHPEKYPELLVRVSGYTAYFKELSPQMQKEIIDRTEYLLSTGKAQQFEPFLLTN